MADTITPLTMPKFGLAMTEGKIASWNVQPGDTVDTGEEIVDIETTKITNGYESPIAGILRRQVAPEGETLPVGALIGVLADKETNDTDIDAFIAKFQSEFSSGAEEEEKDTESEPTIVEVGPLKLRVQTIGHGEETPILFIHGFGGDLTNWMLNQSSLANNRRSISFDLPGHGGSTKDVGDGKTSNFATTTSGLLDALNIEKAHIVGHSLGGAIALRLAEAHPQKVASLTLIAPVGLEKEIDKSFIDGFVTADRRKTLEPVLQKLVADKALISRNMVEGIIRFKRLDGATKSLQTIAEACFPDGQQVEDLRGILAGFNGPAQVIWGADDEILSADGAKNLPDKVKVTIVAGTGHMPQLEKASEVNALITNFIGK
ncbi:acetoin dehydrogenase dihydrolipoyllysine-residue acetyltransferase subunit [Kozakia baliensis]|uniref:Acetoin dehydrogenase n=1 Tax=Kozakia baliensis TaxID=153496 RepID=A0A1D8UST3_9PROT|nr:acetoin dehydrogenase dihydrolipoyllysine-residue acetyltransferase subunit [Kozakia baliensis]AOX16557.1 acetoin dehydrogenase [Kozakia baliensis]GBR24711.1 branched-chain alpha-keto acid dehydrogenase subunit E2 [Kozakia baliensis NRIC 0488]GEL65220.1 branched-chain alpha-keto acid dehydrogenase subunit E2 [Kozakia baliensis]